MTDQQGQQRKPAGDDTGDSLSPDDLNLIDPALEDEGKDDAALWAEFDADEGASPSTVDDDPPSPEPTGEGDDWQDDDSSDDFGDADDHGDDDDQGAAARGGDSDDASARNDKPGDKPGESRQNANDVWVNATPEQRAAFEAAQQQLKKLEQSDKSNRGRVSALQRQLQELRSQPNQPPRDQQGADDADANEFLASDEWKKFAEDYPEVAGPMGGVISKLQQQVARQDKILGSIGEAEQQSALDAQARALEEQHPDWDQVVTEHADAFQEWVYTQPRHIQEAAIRNAQGIVDAEEAADVIGRFKGHLQGQQGNGNHSADDPAGNGSRQGNGNDRLARRRQRQLKSATAARTRSPGHATGIPEDGDPEVLWQHFEEMEKRQAG